MMTVHQKSITFWVLIDLKRLGNGFFPFWFDIGMVLFSCLEIDMVYLFDWNKYGFKGNDDDVTTNDNAFSSTNDKGNMRGG